MKLGAVHFSHLDNEDLEAIYGAGRALSRDARVCGAYGLSNLLKAFVTEVVIELNRRQTLDASIDQLELGA